MPLRDDPGDHGRRELARRGQQPAAVRQLPLALLVVLADHARADVLAPVVELLLQLVLDELALLLDDQDLLEPFGELAHAFGVERPGHADLEDPQADLGRALLVDAEVVQRLPHVEIGLARRDDAQPRLRAVDDDAVEPVDPRIGQRGVDLVALQPQFLLQRRVGPADVEPARRHHEVLGQPRPRSGAGSTCTEAELSTVSAIAFNATQQPE